MAGLAAATATPSRGGSGQRANRATGYLAGIEAAAVVGAVGGPSQPLIKQVSDQLVTTLGLRGCRDQPGVADLGSPPRLRRDGSIVWNGAAWDADRDGLPTDAETELLVETRAACTAATS